MKFAKPCLIATILCFALCGTDGAFAADKVSPASHGGKKAASAKPAAKGASKESAKKATKEAAKESTKEATNEAQEKILFKKWFAEYFAMLYYMKDLSQARPYFSQKTNAVWDKMDAEKQANRAKELRTFYIGNPIIKELRVNPGGITADAHISGYIDVGGKTGTGYLIFHMVKESNVWRIETMKGSASHQEKKPVINPGG